tara:strand:- start:341 stop:736 length:396 start_codon:yes stop_codon:yes gene_type:complete
MIDTSKYEGHTSGHWATTTRKGTWVVYTQDNGDVATMNDYEDAKLIAAAPLLLEEVKRLQYLQKYAPTFQVFAQNEEDMEEEYTQHGSLKECKEYIAALEDGWIGRIEVIEHHVPTDNPQVKTLEEWRNEE